MMFYKNTGKLESLIGMNSSFKGEIDSKWTLRVDGIIEGNIAVDRVVIGEKAQINGNISARGVVVGGKVEGNIKAKEIVEIKDKGQVLGEISTPLLSIAEGAIFDGRSIILPKNETRIWYPQKSLN